MKSDLFVTVWAANLIKSSAKKKFPKAKNENFHFNSA